MDIELDHARLEPRTNMFVMASISATTASGPVKIRNLSSRGALIESSGLPALGESFELKRGSLFAAGEIVWREGNKADLRFDRSIAVVDWLPSANCTQHAVDTLVQQAKAVAAGHMLVANRPPVERDSIDADQLRRLARALDGLADDLADDAAVVTRHAQKLQALDVAAQMLRNLAADQGRTFERGCNPTSMSRFPADRSARPLRGLGGVNGAARVSVRRRSGFACWKVSQAREAEMLGLRRGVRTAPPPREAR